MGQNLNEMNEGKIAGTLSIGARDYFEERKIYILQ